MPANENTNTMLYPPLPAEELRNAHAYENIVRVVVTQNGVWGRSEEGGWIRFQPLASLTSQERKDGNDG